MIIIPMIIFIIGNDEFSLCTVRSCVGPGRIRQTEQPVQGRKGAERGDIAICGSLTADYNFKNSD